MNKRINEVHEFILYEAKTALMLARKLEEENEPDAAYVYRRYGNRLLDLMSPDSSSTSTSFYKSKGE